MNKTVLTIALVIIILSGGAFAYLAMNNDDAEQPSQASNTEQTTTDESNAPTFDPRNPEETSYIATISGTDEGVAIDGSIEADGEGNFRYNFTTDGETNEIIMTDEGTFSCTDSDGCFRLPSNSADGEADFQSPFDPGQFTYDDADFQEFQDLASYQGQQTCSVGRCDVWVYSDENNDATIFIDADGDRVVRVESTDGTSDIVLEYEYQDVTITAPEDYQEIPSVDGSLQ